MPHRPKHILEYLALRGIGAIVSSVPHRAALAIGWLLACLGFAFARRRVSEAERRIRAVFGDRFTTREIRRIAWISWRNIAFDGAEMLRIRRMNSTWIAKTTNCAEIIAPLRDHARTGRGAIVALPHMGNWETAAMAAHQAGVPIFSLVARQRNALVDDYLNRLRRHPGIETLARGSGTMRTVIRRLRQGGFLAILPDVRITEGGIPVPFLGDIARLGPGMALFARHTNLPIFPCYIIRIGWTRQRMHVSDPIWPDQRLAKDEDIRRMTRLVMARIDAWIRETPDQWFWFNRRWVLDPTAPISAPEPPHA